MKHELYLTRSERQKYDVLPASLKEGWIVHEETLSYQDSQRNRAIRFAISRFHDPALVRFRERCHSIQTEKEYLSALSALDLTSLSSTDLSQIAFSIGPDGLSSFIALGFNSVESDEDLLSIGALSELRHELLESLTTIAS